jgi:hypothetical protein
VIKGSIRQETSNSNSADWEETDGSDSSAKAASALQRRGDGDDPDLNPKERLAFIGRDGRPGLTTQWLHPGRLAICFGGNQLTTLGEKATLSGMQTECRRKRHARGGEF